MIQSSRNNDLSPVDGRDEIGRRIVDAAANAIIEHGFGGATTDAIARAARTSKRAIYERFPDRNALFESVMAQLCAEAGESPSASPGTRSLEETLREQGMAVLTRFANPRTQRILAAAVGASATYPAALEIFWERGPGQAVHAIDAVLRTEKRRGGHRMRKPQTEARRFIMALCGPVVLDQLFAGSSTPTRPQLAEHLDETVGSFMRRIGAG